MVFRVNGRLNMNFESSCESHDFEMPARIGDKFGGGKTFKRPGVKKRRLPSDTVHGDRKSDGVLNGIGDNGSNGEFGV